MNAHSLVRIAGWLVPRDRRDEWRERWDGELWAAQAGGMSPWRVALGAIPDAGVEFRHGWTEGWTLAGVLTDVRLAGRHARRAPAAAAAVIGIMGLGAAAVTSLFAVVDVTLLRTPPGVASPGDLVQIGRGDAADFDNFSFPIYRDLHDGLAGTLDLAAYRTASTTVGEGAATRMYPAQWVSTSFFRALGVTVTDGAGLGDSDATPRVVLADWFWRDHQSRIRAEGHTLVVRGRRVAVGGVAPRGFVGAHLGQARPALWGTLSLASAPGEDRLRDAGNSWLWIIGRRAPGVTLEDAQTVVESAYSGLIAASGTRLPTRITVTDGLGLRPDERIEARRISVMLMSAAGLVLLIAAANVAGLQVARAARDRRAIAIRSAMGASKFRLVRALLVEQALLAAGGGLVAWIAARWIAAAIQDVLPYDLAVRFQPDVRMLAFGVSVASGVGVLVALVPLWNAVAPDPAAVLKGGMAAGMRRRRSGLILLIGQVALSAALVSASVLLARSLTEAGRVDPGFDATNVLVAQVRVTTDDGHSAARLDDLRRAMTALPGVRAVGLAVSIPIVGPSHTLSVSVPGDDDPFAPPRLAAALDVDSGFFQVLRIPVPSPPGVRDVFPSGGAAGLVTESLSRILYPDGQAVGHPLTAGGQTFSVAAVLENLRARSLRQPKTPVLFRAIDQTGEPPSFVLLRLDDGVGIGADTLRAALGAFDSRTILLRLDPYDRLLRESLAETNLAARVATPFSFVALLLACAGLYATASRQVENQRRDLGLRLALGAPVPALLRGVLGRAALVGGVGGGVGAAVVASGGGALRSLLFGVGADDPVVFAGTVLVLTLVALLAAAPPALRACRTDPLAALKSE